MSPQNMDEAAVTNGLIGIPRKVPMKVLVLGLSRTGTSTVQEALMKLGYHDVYHTRTVLQRPGDGIIWADFLKRKFEGGRQISREEWDALLGDYMAVTDVPSAIFFRELISTYPSAKVILTIRDSTEVWAKSYSNTINALTEARYLSSSPSPPQSSITEGRISLAAGFDEMMFAQVKYTPRGTFAVNGEEWYERHNREVREAVTEANGELLVFNVKQGWGPLCEFLGKDVPDGLEGESFPKLFDTKAYREMVGIKGSVAR